jgi:hypothetical protein
MFYAELMLHIPQSLLTIKFVDPVLAFRNLEIFFRDNILRLLNFVRNIFNFVQKIFAQNEGNDVECQQKNFFSIHSI